MRGKKIAGMYSAMIMLCYATMSIRVDKLIVKDNTIAVMQLVTLYQDVHNNNDNDDVQNSLLQTLPKIESIRIRQRSILMMV
jgi:hypothetical protein